MTESAENVDGALRVWHVPQIPCKAFIVPVLTVEDGVWLMDVLADYDTFQFENRIKPDYSNISGLERFEDGEWCDVDIEWDLEEAPISGASGGGSDA